MGDTIKVVNLLDDMALGGVTRALAVFDTAPVTAVAASRTVAIPFGGVIPPDCRADVFIVHFTVNWRRIAFLALLRARYPRARIVLVEHSYTRALEPLIVTHKRRFHLMLRIVTRLVHQVVCVSRAQADWLSQVTGLKRDAIAIISPHVTNAGLDTLPLPVLRPGQPLRIGAYGRFSRQKGFDTLAQAFRDGHFPGCELIFGGFGEEEALYREIAADCPQIRFTGQVFDVGEFLRGVDVVALPSRWEAFGMVANEAREAGRPLLVAPVDGLPEHALAPGLPEEDRSGLVFDFHDRAAIAAALARLTPERHAAMALAARRTTAGCGERTQRQWAALIRTLAKPAVRAPDTHGPPAIATGPDRAV